MICDRSKYTVRVSKILDETLKILNIDFSWYIRYMFKLRIYMRRNHSLASWAVQYKEIRIDWKKEEFILITYQGLSKGTICHLVCYTYDDDGMARFQTACLGCQTRTRYILMKKLFDLCNIFVTHNGVTNAQSVSYNLRNNCTTIISTVRRIK